ncbi:hypothetical protein FRC00_014218 [Tulasnella sp. 408]|nr:hypothetical protein FRC00_014218 [Tulasnella sp. 408]
MVGAVPYHPYNTSPHPDDEEAAVGYSGVGGFGRPASQKHRRHSSLPMSSRASEGYAMSSIHHHPFSGAATQSREDDDGHEPEVMAWTGPTHKRASTALAGGAGARWSSVGEHKSSSAGEHKSSSAGDHMQQSSAGDHMQSTAGDHMASSSGEQRSSEGGGSAEFGGGLSPDQGGAPLTRKKSGAASHKTGSTKASVTRKKAPELPLPIDPAAEPTGPAPPPSAYFTSGPGPSTTTVNTGASAYVPSQRDRDRRSADLMAYQNGRQSSEVFGPGTSAPGPSSAFDAFAGAKDGPVHILVPDLPPAHAK